MSFARKGGYSITLPPWKQHAGLKSRCDHRRSPRRGLRSRPSPHQPRQIDQGARLAAMGKERKWSASPRGPWSHQVRGPWRLGGVWLFGCGRRLVVKDDRQKSIKRSQLILMTSHQISAVQKLILRSTFSGDVAKAMGWFSYQLSYKETSNHDSIKQWS
jgi:hypothetical protein